MAELLEIPLLRTSERASFMRCRWAWSHAYVRCVKPHGEAPALRFGTLVHKALEAYYKKGTKRGPHPAITFAKLYAAELLRQEKFGFRDEEGNWADAATLGEAMLNHYVETYGADERWQVLATEMPFQTLVRHPRTGKPWFYYVGVIDLVVKDRQTDFVGLVDHKTSAGDPTKYLEQLELDEQAGAYWRYGRQYLYDNGILRQDRELNGILFNFLRKAGPDPRPKNAEGYHLNNPTKAALVAYCSEHDKDAKGTIEELTKRIGAKKAALLGEPSKSQPPTYFFRTPVWRNDAEGEHVQERVLEQMREMSLARRGKLAIYKNPGPLHMPNCKGCGYRGMCVVHEAGGDWEEISRGTMDEWDPYAEHEIYDRA